jgi:chloramphenicol 3-O-phosphotransferase
MNGQLASYLWTLGTANDALVLALAAVLLLGVLASALVARRRRRQMEQRPGYLPIRKRLP